MKKSFAFTLSEVLITMSIIGVIAALTVPALMNDYQKKTFATQFRKILSEIEGAVDMAISDQGKTKLSSTTFFTNPASFVTSYLKSLKSCSTERLENPDDPMFGCSYSPEPCVDSSGCPDDPTDGMEAYFSIDAGCFATEQTYLSLDKSQDKSFKCKDGAAFLLANSAAICITREARTGIPDINWVVYIDVNGPEPPNMGGRDMFTVMVNKEGTIQSTNRGSDNCLSSAFGDGCYEKLAKDNNWQMKY